jgi:hypothetical protein
LASSKRGLSAHIRFVLFILECKGMEAFLSPPAVYRSLNFTRRETIRSRAPGEPRLWLNPVQLQELYLKTQRF